MSLTLPTLTTMVIGSMTGAGVFSLPRPFAQETGVAGALIDWIVAGTGMLMPVVFKALAPCGSLWADAAASRPPDYAGSTVWWGDPELDWGQATFEDGAAERVVVGMPKLRSAMHLGTVFTFADRDLVTLHPTVMDAVHTLSLRPGDKAPGLDIADEGPTPFASRPQDARPAEAADRGDRRRRVCLRAPAVGQRQQRDRAVSRRILT